MSGHREPTFQDLKLILSDKQQQQQANKNNEI
jgi:hypothetical protein